jgi:hypothetical protein
MRNVKHGIWSTRVKKPVETRMLDDGTVITLPLKKQNGIFASIHNAKETMYTNQTGAFPMRSRKKTDTS